jgi:recombination protein RecA
MSAVNALVDALNKDKNLQKTLDGVKVSMLSDPDNLCHVKTLLPTGCLVLDWMTGGGLPVGRFTEIHGDESTGKTLIASQVAALVQQNGGIVMYIDTEARIFLEMMEEVGINKDELIYAAPDTIEQVFMLIESTLKHKIAMEEAGTVAKNTPMLVVWDSIAATTAMAEEAAGIEQHHIGIHARKIGQGMRKIGRLLAEANACGLFLNQTRTKIGVMFGDDVATPGGKSVDFYSSVRIRLKHGGQIKDGNAVVGMNTRAKVIKSSVCVPFREAELPIFFGHGISDGLAAYEWLTEHGLIEVTGGWGKITINGTEHKIQRNGNWLDVFDDNYDAIADLIIKEA